MLGIGLGGAAKGLESGVGLGQKLQKMHREAEAERGIKEAVESGRAAHEAAVASGTAKPDDADSILRFTMPRLVVPLMKSGDFQGAQAASEWLRSDTTRTATKFWGEGMLLAQAGDTVGAVKKFVAAARTKGYGPDLEIGEPIPLDGGGVRVPIKLSDGRQVTQDFKTPDDVLRFGAAYLNPEAAFKSWQEQQAEARKRAAAIEDYRTKQNIDTETERARTPILTDRERGKEQLKLEFEKQRQQLGLGTPAFEAQNVVQQGPDGKPVVKPYVFNKRSGIATPMRDADGNEIGGEFSKPSARAASATQRRPFQFEVVRDAYKQLGYSDEDATNIAAGKRPPRETELIKLSQQLTTMEMPASDMRYKPEQRRARQEEILKSLREQYSPRSSASAARGAALKPLPPDVLAKAQDAIKRGASYDAVVKRLHENGYDPSPLGKQ